MCAVYVVALTGSAISRLVRQKLLEFYSATCYDVGGDTSLDGVGTITNLGIHLASDLEAVVGLCCRSRYRGQ